MENCDTSRPIPVTCNYCSKEFSSSTIIYHQKKHHSDQPFSYSPTEITCNKCLQIILISNAHSHYTTCEKRIKRPVLGTIIEEIAVDDSRVLCKFCFRKFKIDRIEKHQKACETSSKKRPRFEISKKRVPFLYETYQKITSKRKSLNLVYPNSKWQKQHLELLKNLRYCEDESSCEEYATCQYCLQSYQTSLIESHLDHCKTIQKNPKSLSALRIKFPSIKKIDAKLTVKSSSRWRPSSVLNRNNKSEKLSQNLSLNEPDSLDLQNPNDAAISPVKTPILKKELLDPGNSKNSKKEVLTTVCPHCLKRFISSSFDKHVVSCKKYKLKPSATVLNLDRKEENLHSEIQVHKKYKVMDKRSNSTQRLCESSSVCMACGAVFAKSAKFCMMCGNIRFNN